MKKQIARFIAVGVWLSMVAMVLAGGTEAFGQFKVLHSFTGSSSDGGQPNGSLIQSGSTLYGMTAYGGGGLGTVFKISADGTGFGILHSFTGNTSDGEAPTGSLLLSGSTLYGMTDNGGSGGSGGTGTIFKTNADGSGYSILHNFTGGSSDGSLPYYGSLIQSGSTLYGVTSAGGDKGFGTIFKINTDGSGFALLHKFAGQGMKPYGSLVLSGSTLYGMTYDDVQTDGTIFRVNTDGSGYGVLHQFLGLASFSPDGSRPTGSLILSNGLLYGMTFAGGDSYQNNGGTVFKINTDGSGYKILHSFIGGSGDGSQPHGSLVLFNGVLYGMTYDGGSSGNGTIFQINTDGSGFNVVHNFAGGNGDGAKPYGSLLQSGSAFCGMTSTGGSKNDGVIFSITGILPVLFTLTATVNGGNGTVSPSSGSYPANTRVNLTASPVAHYFVKQWTGTDNDSSTATTNTVTMVSDQTVSVEFVYANGIRVLTQGGGSVTTSPNRSYFLLNESVTLQATGQKGWVFDHWTGNLTGTANPATLTVTGDMSVQAVFVPQSTLSILTVGEGTVTMDPAGPAYPTGSRVTLTAQPDNGWSFRQWTGAINSGSNPVSLTMDKDKTVQAEFVKGTGVNYTLSISIAGNGSVIPLGGSFPAGSSVTLTATADSGWQFDHWVDDTLNVLSTNPVTIGMDKTHALTAVFAEASSGTSVHSSIPTPTPTPIDTKPADSSSQTGNPSPSGTTNASANPISGCGLPAVAVLMGIFGTAAMLSLKSKDR